MVFKCLVLDCPNQSDQGTMVGPLCMPCDEMLRTGKPNKGNDWVSQVCRQHTAAFDTIKIIESAVRKMGC